MKLTFITNLYPPHYLGGYELLCAQVRDALVDRGHEVRVLTSNQGVDGGPAAADDDEYVSRTLRLVRPFDLKFDNNRLAKLLPCRFNRRAARREFSLRRPDLVFVWSQLRLTLGAALAAQDLDIPTAYTINDEHPIAYVSGAFGWRPLQLAGYLLDRLPSAGLSLDMLDMSKAVCISRSLKDRLVEAGVPVRDAKVVYQGIPTGRFPLKDDPGSMHDPVRVLYVGQIHPYKGVHTLVKAVVRLAAMGERAWSLTIVGGGPDEYVRKLKGIAEPIRDFCNFSGKAPYRDLPAVYRCHDIFVFPSTAVEAFGLTFLEAMCSGLPVVSTGVGGHGEVLEDGNNALVFTQGDARGLAACLERLAADGDLRRRLAVSGARMVRDRFDFARYIDEIEEFLVDAFRRSKARDSRHRECGRPWSRPAYQ